MSTTITGQTLIGWGFPPGKWFAAAIAEANRLRAGGAGDDAIVAAVRAHQPVTVAMRDGPVPYGVFLEPETDLERDNLAAVIRHMDELMRVPTIVAGAVMPDACPSGSALGTIPVGGVVACEDAIHPGFHSADICCSVAITVLAGIPADGYDTSAVLDLAQAVTHFGPGDRDTAAALPADVGAAFAANPFLQDIDPRRQFGTQGDGNHFLFVGRLGSTGQLAIVTHHGSRSPGAALYKKGMAAAQRHTAIVAPGVGKHLAWLKADSADGAAYWSALQTIRAWTKANHLWIHDTIVAGLGASIADRFWNEHNFVFQKADGRFYHGKGATPSWDGFSPDDDGRTLIPLNMAEPILIARHRDHAGSLGFAPHGAGRNLSRTQFLREASPEHLEIPPGVDLRSYCGNVDRTELPGAYKNAASVRRQINAFGLAEIVDTVEPFGCIMAGDWEKDMPWRKGK